MGFLVLLFALFTTPAHAHNRATSYSYWDIHNGCADVRVRVSQLELTRLGLDPMVTPDYPAQTGRLLQDRVTLWTDAGPCKPKDNAVIRTGADGWLSAHWRLQCPPGPGLTLRSQLLQDVAPSHLHFVRAQLPDGAVRERVLTRAEPALILQAAAPPAAQSLRHFVTLGVEHILSGWDHMAFILALILLAASLREVAIVATGFTLAHSLTLALAVLGLVQTRGHVVEALIGFSIALVAVENLWLRGGRERWVPWVLVLTLAAMSAAAAFGFTRLPITVLLGLALFSACHFGLLAKTSESLINSLRHPGEGRGPASFPDQAAKSLDSGPGSRPGQALRRNDGVARSFPGSPAQLRLALAFVFGLVHGFGFAGVMAQMNLPPSQLAVGLLGFNSGVELGQLLIIALVWPALRWLARWPLARQWANDGGSAAICALGTYWFVVRSFA